MELFPHQPNWGEKFEQEKDKIREIFGEKALEIEHIGSTSIEGLTSKPIIDIAVLIEKREDADTFVDPLDQLGYRYDKENSSSERHLFRKGDPTEFHLSIAYKNQGGFWDRQILFRDYLRKHPDARDEYAGIKAEMLLKDPTGGDEYISGKSEFIQRILKLAENKQYG